MSRLSPALFPVLFAVLAAWLSRAALHRPPHDRQADLMVYLGSIDAVRGGTPLYDFAAPNGDPFTYPPFALLVLWPLHLPPVEAVRVGWTLATCAAAALLAFTAGRRWAAASVLLVSAPLLSGLRFGQVSVFLVLMVLADRRLPERWRGTLVGLAAAIKLTPLPFVVYLAVTGRRREAVRALGVFGGAAVLGLVVMPDASVRYWTDAVFTTSRIGDLAASGNQSINGALLRLGLDGSLPWLPLAACVGLAGLATARRLHRDGAETAALVAVGCATVAASPVSWNHHQVWTVLAGLLLVSGGNAVRRVSGAAVLLVMTTAVPVPEGRALCAVAFCVAAGQLEWVPRGGRAQAAVPPGRRKRLLAIRR